MLLANLQMPTDISVYKLDDFKTENQYNRLGLSRNSGFETS